MLKELEVALFRGRLEETFGTTAIPDFPMDFALENRSSERSARDCFLAMRFQTSDEDDDVRYWLEERKCALGSKRSGSYFVIREKDRKLIASFWYKIPRKLATGILAYSFGLSKQTVTVMLERNRRKRKT